MRGQAAGFAAMVLLMAAGVAARQTDGRPSPSGRSAPPPVTLTGCVEKGPGPNEFTIADEASGRYRVSGSRINRYVGQRVEVTGTPDNGRLKIRGGLYPSPNAAAGAGGRDPVKAAIAAQPGGPASGTGDINLPELKVKSVKTVGGGCR